MTNSWSWQQFSRSSNVFFTNHEEPWPGSAALFHAQEASRSLFVCVYIYLWHHLFGLCLRPLPHREHRAIPDYINISVTVTEISQARALTWGVSGQEASQNDGCEEDKPASILMNWVLFLIKERKTRTKLWLRFKLQPVFFTEAVCFKFVRAQSSAFLPSLLSHTFKRAAISFWLPPLLPCAPPLFWNRNMTLNNYNTLDYIQRLGWPAWAVLIPAGGRDEDSREQCQACLFGAAFIMPYLVLCGQPSMMIRDS